MTMHDKKTQKRIATFLFAAAFITSCTADKDIKADIAQKAKNDINFAGVTYTVKDEVVTLSGNCPSVKSRLKVWQAVKDVTVVKEIINRVQISPVLLNDDFDLQQAADSILAGYPQAQATVKNHVVILDGKATKKDMDSLAVRIGRLYPGSIEVKLTQEGSN